MIADADTVRPFLRTGNVTVREGPADGAAESNCCYHITVQRLPARRVGLVYFHLRPGVEPLKSSGVAVRLRALAGPGRGDAPVPVQLLGLDAEMHVVLRRWVELQAGAAAREVSVPWTRWQWGMGNVGGAADVCAVGLRIDQPGQEVELDDLRFTDYPKGVDPRAAGRDWLRRVAFGERDVRTAEADGMLVATDATEELTDADLSRILSRMRRARALVHRLFGDAVLPIAGANPPALLIFRDKADYLALGPRLGREWADEMPPPPEVPGLTIQNIASSTFDPAYGPDRPVYVHETVHAVLGNDVRLGHAGERVAWLHEGLASYVQLVVHPRSLTRNPFPAGFAAPTSADRSGYFKPLESLVGDGPGSVRDHVQCASLVAYLVENKPGWLPVIARELAARRTTTEALAACGTSVAELEQAWMAWGKKTFPFHDNGEGDDGVGAGDASPVFPVPPELREAREPGEPRRRSDRP
jgi:hypothetical protein